ncbi:MAG TPA: hypothetical protein EYH25_04430 [Thermotoga sp.]|nr:hypothetical protein [Thermotoga sp.]
MSEVKRPENELKKSNEIIESIIKEVDTFESRMEKKIKEIEEEIKVQEEELKSDIEELLEAEGILPKDEQLYHDLINEISLILKEKNIKIEEKDLIEVIKATIDVYEKVRERKVECASVLKTTMKYVIGRLRGYRVSVKFEPTKYPMQLIIQVFY